LDPDKESWFSLEENDIFNCVLKLLVPMFGLVEHEQSGLELLLDPVDDLNLYIIFRAQLLRALLDLLKRLLLPFWSRFFDSVVKVLSALNIVLFILSFFELHLFQKALILFLRNILFRLYLFRGNIPILFGGL
jgi:hypothetical protein